MSRVVLPESTLSISRRRQTFVSTCSLGHSEPVRIEAPYWSAYYYPSCLPSIWTGKMLHRLGSCNASPYGRRRRSAWLKPGAPRFILRCVAFIVPRARTWPCFPSSLILAYIRKCRDQLSAAPGYRAAPDSPKRPRCFRSGVSAWSVIYPIMLVSWFGNERPRVETRFSSFRNATPGKTSSHSFDPTVRRPSISNQNTEQ